MEDLQKAVEDVAKSLKIGLSSEEKKNLAGGLSNFLDWLAPLLQVDTDEVEPFIYGHRAVNVLREDKPEKREPSRLQGTAVNFAEGFYRVPPVME